MLSLFHEVGILDNVVREVNLLEGLLVHEVESVLVRVEELVWTPFHIDGLDLGTCCEGVLEDASVLKVAKFSLYECWTLSRLHVLEIHDHTRFAVEIQVHSVFEVSCCCHINCV